MQGDASPLRAQERVEQQDPPMDSGGVDPPNARQVEPERPGSAGNQLVQLHTLVECSTQLERNMILTVHHDELEVAAPRGGSLLGRRSGWHPMRALQGRCRGGL